MASYSNAPPNPYNQNYNQASPSGPYKAGTTPGSAELGGGGGPYPSTQGLTTDPTAPTPNFHFTEKSLRLGFIRKVYGILTLQLLVTFGFVTLCSFETNIQKFVQGNTWSIGVAWGIIFVSVILLACCSNVARTSPGNYIILSVLTLAMSWSIGTTASYFETDTVVMAMGITLTMTIAITVFSFQTRYDFTPMYGSLLIFVIALLFFAIFGGVWHTRVLSVFYGVLGALLFGLYLVVDTQLMLGGRHKFSFSPEDYIFAALSLYLDIINMFLYILQIVAAASR